MRRRWSAPSPPCSGSSDHAVRGRYRRDGRPRKISEISYGQNAGKIEVDNYLRRRLNVRDFLIVLENRTKRDTLLVTSADAKVITDIKSAGIMIDHCTSWPMTISPTASSVRAGRAVPQSSGKTIGRRLVEPNGADEE